MPRVIRNTDTSITLPCDDPEDSFNVGYDNQGEPFREGIRIGISNDNYDKEVTVMLENNEAKQLRDLLLEHYPIETKRAK